MPFQFNQEEILRKAQQRVSSSRKPAIFTKETYKNALPMTKQKSNFYDGHSAIVIQANPVYTWQDDPVYYGLIKGVMLDQIKISVSSDWQEMGFNAIPFASMFADTVSNFSRIVGGGDVGAHWASRLLWRKNGYLEITPHFRVIDWGDTNDRSQPLTATQLISKFLLPKEKDDNIADRGEELGNITGEIGGRGEEIMKGAFDKGIDKIGNLPIHGELVRPVQNFARNVVNPVVDGISDVLTLQAAPPPISIQIGQWFYLNDMVIENATFEYSKEISEFGPLYVDIMLQMKSRKIIRNLSDIGVRGSIIDHENHSGFVPNKRVTLQKSNEQTKETNLSESNNEEDGRILKSPVPIGDATTQISQTFVFGDFDIDERPSFAVRETDTNAVTIDGLMGG